MRKRTKKKPPDNKNQRRLEDFNALLKKAASPTARRGT